MEIDASTAILDTRLKNALTVVAEESMEGTLRPTEARISPGTADLLGLYQDGPVRVLGKKRRENVLVMVHDKGMPDGCIALSDVARTNLHVGLKDNVKVYAMSPADVPLLKSVEFQPVLESEGDMPEDVFGMYVLPFFDHERVYVTEGNVYPLKAEDGHTLSFRVGRMKPEDGWTGGESRHGVAGKDTGVDSTKVTRPATVAKERELVGYDSIGGCRRQLAQIREMIELPLKQPGLFERIGVRAPKGVLMHGPPGTGKTLIARAIANESGAYLHVINGPEIMSQMAGESESNLRKVFEEAAKNAPAIIFIDEIDSIAPNREKTQGEQERRIVSQLLTLMDGMKAAAGVIVIGATNRPNALDPALRRFGRFDREILIGVPDDVGRLEVLGIHTREMSLAPDVDLEAIAKEIHGFTGSDIASLCSEAAVQCIREHLPQLDLDNGPLGDRAGILHVTNDNFRYAIENTDPSSLRETVIESPNVRWADIGGLEGVKRELKETVQYPVNYPEKYLKFGQTPSKGVLLYGPPGCGKTLLAKAVATECNANFISIKGPELITKYVGESEENVRQLFDKARASAPCVLFFDEIDSIGMSRSSAHNDGGTTDRVLNQLLAEMDGMNQKKNVFVVGATNRPANLDTALMRPGRLDQLVYIPLPDSQSRLSIIRAKLRHTPLANDVSLEDIAASLEGFSGADITELCQRAAKLAIRQSIEIEMKNPKLKEDPVPCLTRAHFDEALKTARKSVSKQEIESFEAFARTMKVEMNRYGASGQNAEDDGLYD